MNWAVLAWKFVFDAYSSIFMIKQCMDNLEYAKTYVWLGSYTTEVGLHPLIAVTPVNDGIFAASEELELLADKESEKLNSYDFLNEWDVHSLPQHDVGTWELKPWKVTVWSAGIIYDAFDVYQNYGSNFYYYNFGKSLTSAATKLFILIDHLA